MRALAGRLAVSVVVVLGVCLVTFVFLRLLAPQSFAFEQGSLPGRTAEFMWGVVSRGDIGRSRNPPFPLVLDVIRTRLAADVWLVAGALLFGVVAGSAAGAYCAFKPRSIGARALDALALFALCAPVYWVGLMLVLLFVPGAGRAFDLGVFMPGVYEPLTEDPLRWLQGLAAPWVVAGLPFAAACLRMMRLAMRETLDEDYLRTARAKGVRERVIAFRHAGPAASAPVIALAGAWMPILIGNVLLVEQVFNVPGILRETPRAIFFGDYELVQGIVIVGAVLVVIGNLLADLALARLDPRVRPAQ